MRLSLNITRRTLWPMLLLVLSIGSAPFALPPAPGPDGAQLILGYMAGDYAGAVGAGGNVTNPAEYAEMEHFAAEIVRFAENPDVPASLKASAARLQQLVAAKAPPAEVKAFCDGLAVAVGETFQLSALPTAVPDLAVGQRRFQEWCAPCHGATGRGDGPKAKDLEPPPKDFTAEMAHRSPAQLRQVIRLGVPGTAMAAFKDPTEGEVWSLAFYILTLSHPPAATPDGKAPGIGVAELASLSDEQLVEALLDRGVDAQQAPAWVSVFRLEPRRASLETPKADPLRVALQHLRAAQRREMIGDHASAYQLVLRAYLEGFENAEGQLLAAPGADVPGLERRFADLQNALAASRPEARASLDGLVADLQDLARPREATPVFVFLQSGMIVFREGLEAILLVTLLLASTSTARRSPASAAAGAGGLLAVFAGIAVWFVSRVFVDRFSVPAFEVGLLATWIAVAILLWILLGPAASMRELRSELQTRSAGGAWFGVGSLAFIAVFREAAEVVVFFTSLWERATANRAALVGGLATGSVVLALLYLLLSRGGRKLPVPVLFRITTWGLLIVLLIAAGQATQGLQQLGWLSVHPLGGFRALPSLGLFPALETLIVQASLLGLFLWISRRRASPRRA